MIKKFVAWYVRNSGGFWDGSHKVAWLDASDTAWIDRRDSALADLSALMTRAQNAERENAKLMQELQVAEASAALAKQSLEEARASFDDTVSIMSKVGAQMPDASILIRSTDASDGTALCGLRFNGTGYTVTDANFAGSRQIRSGDILEVYGRLS